MKNENNQGTFKIDKSLLREVAGLAAARKWSIKDYLQTAVEQYIRRDANGRKGNSAGDTR